MENTDILKTTLGEIVAEDFRRAPIFSEAGLDFCCGGKKTLNQACFEKSVDPGLILARLNELQSVPQAPGQNFNEWPLGFLTDYIVNTHHKYVTKALPDLEAYTAKIADVHGSHHPELKEVASLFRQVAAELRQHMKKEEEVLFPVIKEASVNGSESARNLIASEISRMTGEHEFAGGAMDLINEKTNGYSLPVDACNTYHVTFKLLRQFEDDLHIHVHLENNILFPKSLNL